jgi:hypothetical protein
MFKKIVIELSGPICTCDKGDLEWIVIPETKGPALTIRCKTCNVKLIIPYEKFIADFKVDTSYPGGWAGAPVTKNETEKKKADANPAIYGLIAEKLN